MIQPQELFFSWRRMINIFLRSGWSDAWALKKNTRKDGERMIDSLRNNAFSPLPVLQGYGIIILFQRRSRFNSLGIHAS